MDKLSQYGKDLIDEQNANYTEKEQNDIKQPIQQTTKQEIKDTTINQNLLGDVISSTRIQIDKNTKDVVNTFGGLFNSIKESISDDEQSDKATEANLENANNSFHGNNDDDDKIKNETNEILKTTQHGKERIAGNNVARNVVLSAQEIRSTKSAGKVFEQADGAKVYLHEISPGKFNAVVQDKNGIITTMRHWSQNSINRIGKNYGWKLK